jgi:Protein of unknown function (DUF2735)
MNDSLKQGSARIYRFSLRGGAPLVGRRYGEIGQPKDSSIANEGCSDSWYHEAAIQEATPKIGAPMSGLTSAPPHSRERLASKMRERADECRRLAATITEEHSRRGFLQVARLYDALATKEEASRKR